jgi:5-methylcytosine-specific restriction endonuclease McrA
VGDTSADGLLDSGMSQRSALPEAPRKGSTRAWRALRLQVLRRDRFICVECGALAVEVDHLVERERGGRDDAENLRSLRESCHAERHGRKVVGDGRVDRQPLR